MASSPGIVSFTFVQKISERCSREHASPGAALLFTSGPAYGEAIVEYRGEALYHTSLDGAEYRKLLELNGFRIVSHVVEALHVGVTRLG
jgi:hypothetical protein